MSIIEGDIIRLPSTVYIMIYLGGRTWLDDNGLFEADETFKARVEALLEVPKATAVKL